MGELSSTCARPVRRPSGKCATVWQTCVALSQDMLTSATFLRADEFLPLADEPLLLVDDLHTLAGAVFLHDDDDVIPLSNHLVPEFDGLNSRVPASKAAGLFAKAAACL